MNIRPRRQEYDVIVVGSGMSGGWAAKDLTELGARVLVLEAGPMIVPERDYAEHLPTYEMPYRGWNDRQALAATQPIQRECYACDEVARKFFVNDIENPYTTDPDKPFSWIRGRQVGGRSIMWGRQCYRMSDLDFEANARGPGPFPPQDIRWVPVAVKTRISSVPRSGTTMRPSGNLKALRTMWRRYGSSPSTAPIVTVGSGPIRHPRRDPSAGRAFSVIRMPALSRISEVGRSARWSGPLPIQILLAGGQGQGGDGRDDANLHVSVTKSKLNMTKCNA